jgi:hypothetical protein
LVAILGFGNPGEGFPFEGQLQHAWDAIDGWQCNRTRTVASEYMGKSFGWGGMLGPGGTGARLWPLESMQEKWGTFTKWGRLNASTGK